MEHLADTTPSSGERWRRFLNRENVMGFAPALGLIALVIAFSLLEDRFFTAANFKTIVQQCSVLMIMCVAETLIVLMGLIDLSIEGNMVLSMALVASLMANNMSRVDIGLWALLVAAAVSAVAGLLNGLIQVKLRIPSFVTTLGTWFVFLGAGVYFLKGGMTAITDTRLIKIYTGSLGAPQTSAKPPEGLLYAEAVQAPSQSCVSWGH